MGKYDPLAAFLEGLPGDQNEVELSFGRIDGLVGGLPPSSRRLRTWWANNSQGQSLAWNRCGWHVRTVDLAGSTVIFARGRIGGSYAGRGRSAANPAPSRLGSSPRPETAVRNVLDSHLQLAGAVDARVTFDWRRFGVATLDSTGKVAFPGSLPRSPGLYRLTLTGDTVRRRIYIGESDNLRRRLNTNYRNPGPRQQTSLRINALLIEHLRNGGHVTLDICVEAKLRAGESGVQAVDLGRKAGRLLAESAALVLAQQSAQADIVNLG